MRRGSRIEDRGSRERREAICAVLGSGILWTPSAFASDAAFTGPGLLQATLGLALVVGMILALAWIAKRLAPGALRQGGTPLTIVASQAVGQRERVVVVEVADQWLVIGVAPGQVRPLTTMPKGVSPAPSARPATSPFAAALSRALGRRDG